MLKEVAENAFRTFCRFSLMLHLLPFFFANPYLFLASLLPVCSNISFFFVF
jgi:hypothetical protein